MIFEYNGVVVILKLSDINKLSFFFVFLCYLIFFGLLFLFGFVIKLECVFNKCFIKYFCFLVELEIKLDFYINNVLGWFFFKFGFFIVNCVFLFLIDLIVFCKMVLFELLFLFLVFLLNNRLFLLNCGYEGN